MEKLNKDQLEQAFHEVRKAYRLLYHYQKRVLDLIQFIGDYTTFSDYRGQPHFSGEAKNKKINLKSWAWDWLNMYLYEFNLGKNIIEGKELAFSIVLESDSGYFNSSAEGITRLDVEEFKSPADSNTNLVFVVDYNKRETELLSKPSKYIKDNEYVNRVAKDQVVCAKKYPLSEFVDEESTIIQLKDFNAFCKKEGIPILKNEK
jgi:hypothetical protein